jgi:hypothetical protein
LELVGGIFHVPEVVARWLLFNTRGFFWLFELLGGVRGWEYGAGGYYSPTSGLGDEDE